MRKIIYVSAITKFKISRKFGSRKSSLESQITGFWDNHVFREAGGRGYGGGGEGGFGLNFNDQWNCKKRSIGYYKNIKILRNIINFFDKLPKAIWKGSLELQKLESWTTVAFTWLLEVTQHKSKAHWNDASSNMYSFPYVYKGGFAQNVAGSIPICMPIFCLISELPNIKWQFCIRSFKEIYNVLLLKATLSLELFPQYATSFWGIQMFVLCPLSK